MITMTTIILIFFGLFSIAFGYPLATTDLEHEHDLAPTSAPSSPPPAYVGASLSDGIKATIIGLLIVFFMAVAALTCLGYKCIRDSWLRRWRGRPWGGTGTGVGPPGTPTGGHPPFFQYQPIAPPSPAHIVNANGNNEPVQLKVLQPAPLGVTTGFGRK